MFRSELGVSVVLAISACWSFIVFFLTRETDGKIQLPSHDNDYGDGLHENNMFNVMTPEDDIDGYPTDAYTFWASMRQRKLYMSLLLVVISAISAVLLGWSVAFDDTLEIGTGAFHVGFALYILGIVWCSVDLNTSSFHSKSILHVTALTSLASVLLISIAILPEATIPIEPVVETTPILWLWHARLGLYIILCVMTVTTRLGPRLRYPPELIYTEKVRDAGTNTTEDNVSGYVGGSPWGIIWFSYVTRVVWYGNTASSVEVADLPIVPGAIRATYNFTKMQQGMRENQHRITGWHLRTGSGWTLAYYMLHLNWASISLMLTLAVIGAGLFYIPALFMKWFVAYLEVSPDRREIAWGWVCVVGIFVSNAVICLLVEQVISIARSTIQVRLRMQLNSVLYAKTLKRKDIVSSTSGPDNSTPSAAEDSKVGEDELSSKAQVMTLMTTDVDRVGDLPLQLFMLIDSPLEIVIGTIFLYKLLGVSCLIGLAVNCIFLPLNHFIGKVIVKTQDNLMKSRDERVALMNEVLGGIRMLKFMAWERNFEKRVLKVREKELKYQKVTYTIEVLWNFIWTFSPILFTLLSFWHFAVVREQALTPSIAFTSIIVFREMKSPLNNLPEIFVNLLQSMVSIRRIEKYLDGADVAHVPPIRYQSQTLAFQSCTVSWPQDRSGSVMSSVASTPRHKFMLVDMTLKFPEGELSLICGKLGSGKTLMLLALLGEADVSAGQVLSPRSPPDFLASVAGIHVPKEQWIIKGICAYVPQTPWLRNASIKDNILFDLPLDAERYQKTLEACALVSDLQILEDGDDSEIGERGVNLSGGQKARVSLARAVYSRASILFLDDVLSAVDVHTARHLYWECLRGELLLGRTVILVSHHVQLCTPGASYIVALDNGRVQFEGSRDSFQNSDVKKTLVHSTQAADGNEQEIEALEKVQLEPLLKSDSTLPSTSDVKVEKRPPRKLVEEEARAVGRIAREIWATYVRACGNKWYWGGFIAVFIVASIVPVLENSWLRYWSSFALNDQKESPSFYVAVYAAISVAGVVLYTLRWFVLFDGSIRASTVLYQRLLETILFASIRFHDTVSRGRLLNRFGKDFEVIDSRLSSDLGYSIVPGLSCLTTLVTISVVGGLPFVFAVGILALLYYNVAKIYGQTSRDMRRLNSVTRSPLYSMYGETISGVTVIRAFGASSKFLRDMLRCVDTNTNSVYWMCEVSRWVSIRLTLLACGIIAVTAAVCLVTPSISASFAGFVLAFASTITLDMLFMVQRFVGLEQSMVALERVKEYSELPREPPEFIEPRPPVSWPSSGAIKCQDLVIRYAPELPDVLHRLNFSIHPGEKVGILGRTGSGKSTLALSFFRFVEATEGRIVVDGLDIANIGLTDLRSKLTIIPQDPTILSGTLRSTLDVFDEYDDAEIFEAIRRVHLISSGDTTEEELEMINVNAFRNLDFAVSEEGQNFSTGEKQLLCMARAILKRSKVLVMDEATASVDYATDELIGKTIRQEFADSTILTIAHRLRTIIDYDRVMVLDDGHIAEFDKPSVLLGDPGSKFYALCKATGKEEFMMLKKMAGVP